MLLWQFKVLKNLKWENRELTNSSVSLGIFLYHGSFCLLSSPPCFILLLLKLLNLTGL